MLVNHLRPHSMTPSRLRLRQVHLTQIRLRKSRLHSHLVMSHPPILPRRRLRFICEMRDARFSIQLFLS